MKILGTGSALPKYTLDNEQLTRFLDTSDEWIRTRTGIQSRQIITDESVLELAARASNAALENAGILASDIDYILCSTVQADTVTPSLGCLLQAELGAQCPAVDINGACAGFVYTLDLADAYLATGRAQRMLVVCSEAMSRMVDWTDRSTCVLFGDGAGAAVVEAGERLLAVRLTSEGEERIINMYPCPGNSPFAKHSTPMKAMFMAGSEVYKFAVAHSADDLRYVCETAQVSLDEVDHYLLHQANKRIVDAVRVRLKQPEEKFPSNIAVRGNTSSASIPILMDELNRAGHFNKGDMIALSAFGAGLTTGACIFRWTKDWSTQNAL